MKKKLISLFTAMYLILGILGTFTAFADDTSTYITEISTLAELEAFRNSVNAGNTYEGRTVTLTADIDMSEKYGEGKESWTSIKAFWGNFDGRGHKITKLYINDTGCGLFEAVEGTVKELGVEGYIYATFNTAEVIGGITANLSGTLERCYFSGSVEGERHIGGIAGASGNGKIIDCYNTGTITAWEHCGGGIVGTGEMSSLTRCYNAGTITKPTSEHASPYYGSITGGGYKSPSDCYYLEGTHDNGAYLDTGEDTITLLTAEQFADKSNFTNWDFDTVWDMDETLGRPVLRSNRETSKHIHKICADENCSENHEDIEWTAWDSDTSLPDTAGNYYLTKDVAVSATWNITNSIKLCLNGHIIMTDNPKNLEHTIEIDSSAITIFTDCSDNEHKFSVGDKGLWVRDEEHGTKTLTGGVIISPSSYAVISTSPLDMYNINISGSNGGIFNTDTLNMYGCTVAGNSGYDGVCSYYELNMRDCSIFENTGDGVYIDQGSISIGGKIIISNNTKNGKQYNLNLRRKIVLQISSPLSEGSTIGVSTSKRPFTDCPTAITGENDTDYSHYFISDNIDKHVTYSIQNGENNVIYLAANTPTDFHITRDGLGTILASVPKAGTYTAILAIYSNDDDILRSVTTIPVTFDQPSVKKIYDDKINVDYSYTLKLMLWDNMEGMRPCCSDYHTTLYKFNN